MQHQTQLLNLALREMEDILRWEEREALHQDGSDDYGSDLDGILECYDSEEDWSFSDGDVTGNTVAP